jgi:hypothetical protein
MTNPNDTTARDRAAESYVENECGYSVTMSDSENGFKAGWDAALKHVRNAKKGNVFVHRYDYDQLRAEVFQLRTDLASTWSIGRIKPIIEERDALRAQADKYRAALERIGQVYYGREYFMEHASIAHAALAAYAAAKK